MPSEFTDAQLKKMIEVRKRRPPKNLAVVDQNGCTGCEVCIVFCPADCINWAPIGNGVNPVVEVDYDRCIGCTLCAQYCPWDTIFMLPYKEALEVAAPQLTIRHAQSDLTTFKPAGRSLAEEAEDEAETPAPKKVVQGKAANPMKDPAKGAAQPSFKREVAGVESAIKERQGDAPGEPREKDGVSPSE
ncbi:MAG: 4Fe-4S binding protein [Chloroflexi bacterium]|nr:4Fe-4S binding protein [Chloroflexota bacterium]